MENILFRKDIRNGRKFLFGKYFNSEKLTLKEKMYILWFGLHKNQGLRRDEMEFDMTILKFNSSLHIEMEEDFKRDYIGWQQANIKTIIP